MERERSDTGGRRMKYILKHRKPIPCNDILKWSRWFETKHRRIRRTEVGEVVISTVFLGIDHALSGPPELFETMAFDKEMNELHCERCSTHRQALNQHWAVVKMAKESGI